AIVHVSVFFVCRTVLVIVSTLLPNVFSNKSFVYKGCILIPSSVSVISSSNDFPRKDLIATSSHKESFTLSNVTCFILSIILLTPLITYLLILYYFYKYLYIIYQNYLISTTITYFFYKKTA